MHLETIQRNVYGSIDFGFYRKRASFARRQARKEIFKRAFVALKQFARTLGAREEVRLREKAA